MRISEDIETVKARDPAARSSLEIILVYPGFHALQFHKLASMLHHRGLKLLGLDHRR
jgi:serine O-acetyltransferase